MNKPTTDDILAPKPVARPRTDADATDDPAQTLGLSITDCTETAVTKTVEAVLTQAGRIALSEAEFARFLAAIKNPPAPAAKLREAAEVYKKRRESDPHW